MDTMVLKEENKIAKGSHRAIYSHDDFKGKCFKVAFKSGQIILRNQNKHWYKKIRPLSMYNENIKEIRAYRILNTKNNEIFNFIPKFYGIYKTNLGEAILIDYIDGITLHKYLDKFGFTEQLKQKFLELFKTFYKNNVQIRDQHLENYLVKTNESGDVLGLYLIDGIGNAQLFPIADYIPYFGRKQLLSRVKVLIRNLKRDVPKIADFVDKNFNFDIIKNSLNKFILLP